MPEYSAQDPSAFVPPPVPQWGLQEGRFVRLERLDPARHAEALFAANAQADRNWDFLPYGPFDRFCDYESWLRSVAKDDALRFVTIIPKDTDRPCGVASYLRITPAAGSIEVGHINFAPALQGTPAATEAMVLMMAWAFGAGYRRYEWKCDGRNLPSRRAAQRLGLSFEGIFRQAAIVKGRNRDTAWFAAVDNEWPRLRDAYRTWLAPENFDVSGRQRVRLSNLTMPLLVSRDPSI